MKLSIVLTNYNYSCYLPEAIESVLMQRFSDYELIIIDDASTDHSSEIIRKYAKQDKRIKFIEHKQNLGVCCSLNNGFQASAGEYFHGFSADDKYQPGFLEKTLNHLEKHPDIGLCCSDYGYFYTQKPNDILTNKLIDTATFPQVFSPRKIVSAFRDDHFWIPGHTTIAKRALIKKYGCYNPNLHAKMDWFLFHSIALCEGAGYIPETLSTMRLHPHTYSSQCSKNTTIQKEMHKTLFECLEDSKHLQLKDKFKKSALLGFLFKDIQALKHPKLWSFYPPLIQKSIRYRMKNLMKSEK